jgi:uncharacterized protein involved in outer membrane biogenesis
MSVDFSSLIPHYSTVLKMEDIPVENLADAFFPFLRGHVKGKIFSEADLKSESPDPKQLVSHLNGSIRIQGKNGELQDIPILDALVTLTQIKGLEILKFWKADGDLNFKNGTLHINFMDYIGELQKLGISGIVDLSSSPQNPPIDLQLRLAVGPALIKGLSKYLKYVTLTDEDGYVHFPRVIAMKGSFNHPKTTVKFNHLLDALKVKALDRWREKKAKDEIKEESTTESKETPKIDEEKEQDMEDILKEKAIEEGLKYLEDLLE